VWLGLAVPLLCRHHSIAVNTQRLAVATVSTRAHITTNFSSAASHYQGAGKNQPRGNSVLSLKEHRTPAPEVHRTLCCMPCMVTAWCFRCFLPKLYLGLITAHTIHCLVPKEKPCAGRYCSFTVYRTQGGCLTWKAAAKGKHIRQVTAANKVGAETLLSAVTIRCSSDQLPATQNALRHLYIQATTSHIQGCTRSAGCDVHRIIACITVSHTLAHTHNTPSYLQRLTPAHAPCCVISNKYTYTAGVTVSQHPFMRQT